MKFENFEKSLQTKTLRNQFKQKLVETNRQKMNGNYRDMQYRSYTLLMGLRHCGITLNIRITLLR